MCPWCYIGYRKLQAAQTMWLQKYPNDTFSIRWKPFLLRPDLPRGVSRDKMTAYTEKFGADRIPMLLGRVAEAGEQVGIKFKSRLWAEKGFVTNVRSRGPTNHHP